MHKKLSCQKDVAVHLANPSADMLYYFQRQAIISEKKGEDNMNDLEYRYFYEVAMTLNFSQAAERLFISQPALSRCISNLERNSMLRFLFATSVACTLPVPELPFFTIIHRSNRPTVFSKKQCKMPRAGWFSAGDRLKKVTSLQHP